MDLLAAHMVGDYILQSDHQAKNKLTDPKVRAEHVSLYHVPFIVLGIVMGADLRRLIAFTALSWVAHYVTDSRRWARADWPPKPILVDQTIHAVCLTLLNRVLGRTRR